MAVSSSGRRNRHGCTGIGDRPDAGGRVSPRPATWCPLHQCDYRARRQRGEWGDLQVRLRPSGSVLHRAAVQSGYQVRMTLRCVYRDGRTGRRSTGRWRCATGRSTVVADDRIESAVRLRPHSPSRRYRPPPLRATRGACPRTGMRSCRTKPSRYGVARSSTRKPTAPLRIACGLLGCRRLPPLHDQCCPTTAARLPLPDQRCPTSGSPRLSRSGASRASAGPRS